MLPYVEAFDVDFVAAWTHAEGIVAQWQENEGTEQEEYPWSKRQWATIHKLKRSTPVVNLKIENGGLHPLS